MSRFRKSCDICQRTIQKGRVTKVSSGKLPLIDTPLFKRVAVDIVGPIEPRSERKSRYILAMIDKSAAGIYQSYRADTLSILKITKGNNSAKNAGGATVVNICTSSGHALYLYQVS